MAGALLPLTPPPPQDSPGGRDCSQVGSCKASLATWPQTSWADRLLLGRPGERGRRAGAVLATLCWTLPRRSPHAGAGSPRRLTV